MKDPTAMIRISRDSVRPHLSRLVLLLAVSATWMGGLSFSYGMSRPDPLSPLLRDAARAHNRSPRAPFAPGKSRAGFLVSHPAQHDPGLPM